MKLVYREDQQEVQVGDTVRIRDNWYDVSLIIKPHKPSSTGRVEVTNRVDGHKFLYFPTVIDAYWIEGEDHDF